MELELIINNEQRVLPSVHAFIHQTLVQLSLEETAAANLEQFVMQAVVDAIAHAYPAGESGSIKVAISEQHGKLEIRIRDFGLPLDVPLLEKNLHDSTASAVLHGSHTPDVADELHWLAFGREGKALQIIKWLHTTHITDCAAASDLAPVPDDVALAPEQSYEIRRMLPEEAVQVSQLMYRTYGGTYFNEDVYYPERIAAQNANGSLISVVAIAEDGSVVAHEAVERDEAGPVAELGQAATDPAHRGRGLMSQIKQLLAEETQHMDLAGWFADAVAVHTFTQQSNAHHGGHVCGVDLGISPKSEAFRSIADQQSQRVSCLIYFHWLLTPQVRTVHVPARHQAIINKVYANLECPVIVGEETSNVAGHGSLKIKRVSGAATAFISVEEMGLDSAAAIRRAVRELIEVSRAEVVFVDLPLADPLTAVVWDSLAADGLGFVGIGPHFSTRGDIARLAYLVEPMVREPIKTFEPFAGELVDYVLAEQDRVRANS